MIWSNASALVRIVPTQSRVSSGSFSPKSKLDMPMIAFIGVRSS